MHRKISALFTAFAVAFLLALPSQVSAQVDAGGTTKFTLAGGGFLGSNGGNLYNILGISYFGSGGFEFGGDVILSLSRTSSGDTSSTNASGFAFGRVTYNFIGESLFIPFVTTGLGAPLEDSPVDYLLDLGVGFKKFISDRVSFDAQASYRGQSTEAGFDFQDGVSLFYGLSIYVGG